MYLKKIDGPRAVTLPDGSIMTRADLPPAETRRWVASRKARVVKAVAFGLLPLKSVWRRILCRKKSLRCGKVPLISMAKRGCG